MVMIVTLDMVVMVTMVAIPLLLVEAMVVGHYHHISGGSDDNNNMFVAIISIVEAILINDEGIN